MRSKKSIRKGELKAVGTSSPQSQAEAAAEAEAAGAASPVYCCHLVEQRDMTTGVLHQQLGPLASSVSRSVRCPENIRPSCGH